MLLGLRGAEEGGDGGVWVVLKLGEGGSEEWCVWRVRCVEGVNFCVPEWMMLWRGDNVL